MCYGLDLVWCCSCELLRAMMCHAMHAIHGSAAHIRTTHIELSSFACSVSCCVIRNACIRVRLRIWQGNTMPLVGLDNVFL